MEFYNRPTPDTHHHHPLRQSTRLAGYNYTQSGTYFVTICTYERCLLLENISQGVIQLNMTGEIVQSCWTEINRHFAFTDTSIYVIMPNHIHGIIVINHPLEETDSIRQKTESEAFGKAVRNSLPTIVRSFKSAATKRVNANLDNEISNLWQRGYYEHVIRSEEEMAQIGDYNLGNPQKWETDRENPFLSKKVNPMFFEY
jgi:putative transposase